MKTYKGFNPDMTCRAFKYKQGEEYETDTAVCCRSGFHACEMPLDCFKYYQPSKSIYCEVEQGGDISKGDNKISSTKIKIGARLSIEDIVRAQIDLVFDKIKKSKNKFENQNNCECAVTSGFESSAATSGDGSSAVTSGDWSSAVTSGFESSAVASGYRSSAATSGDGSSAVTSGDWSSAVTSGFESSAVTSGFESSAATSGDGSSAATSGDGSSAATSGEESSAATSGNGSSAATSGDWSSAATSGYKSSAATSGNGSSAATSGDWSSAATSNKNAIVLACGKKAKAKGVKGSYLVLTEWNEDSTELLCAKMERVDGEKIKSDTWYWLENGEFVEVSEN